jgi:type III secretion protein N (ATPase)
MTFASMIQTEFGHCQRVQAATNAIAHAQLQKAFGEVTGVSRNTLRVQFAKVGQGSICRIGSGLARGMLAEVIALNGEVATLSVLGEALRVQVGDRVEFISDGLTFPFYDELPGTVLNGIGDKIDGMTVAKATMRRARSDGGLPALDRPLIEKVMHTGVAAIDGFLTLGQGQRIALFGPPGCGKSTLLAQIIANCTADVVVLAMVGERGREVQEFLQRHMPPSIRKRCVLVVSTSDRPAMERAYAVDVASSIAEGFRDKGKNVLLLVDSMTRVARALREIGLSAGEPAVRRGFPASVYAALPKIIERAGRTKLGSITAIYAVLSEGDTSTDPIVEEIKSLTDGHIQLNPELAAAGRFPAIDVVGSLSRVMPEIVGRSHSELAAKGRRNLAKYDELKLLIQIGEYKAGQDAEADEAVAKIEGIRNFVHAGRSGSYANIGQTLQELRKAMQ